MHRRHGRARVTFTLGLALALTALAGASASANTTLTVIGHWSGWQLAEFNKNAERYMQLHPDIDIDFIYAPMDQSAGLNKLLTLTAANTMPDIVHTYLALAPELYEAGMFAPAPPAIVEEAERFFFEPILGGVSYQGKLYGLPTENQTYVLSYNKTRLEQAGYAAPPKTWAELHQMAGRLTRTDGSGAVQRYGLWFYPAASFIQFTHEFLTFLWGNGGTYIDEQGRAHLDESPAGDTLRYLTELAASGFMTTAGVGIQDDTAAMAVIPSWWRQGLMASKAADYSDLRTTLVPVGAGSDVAYQYGWGLFVTKQSPHAKAAWDFLRWLTMQTQASGSTPMGDHMEQLGSLPTNRADLGSHASYTNDAFYGGFIKSLYVSRPEPQRLQISERQQAIAKALGPAVQGQVSPAVALAQAQQQVMQILDEAQTQR